MAGSSSRVMDRSYIVLRLDGDAAFSSLSPMGGATLVSLSDGRGGGDSRLSLQGGDTNYQCKTIYPSRFGI